LKPIRLDYSNVMSAVVGEHGLELAPDAARWAAAVAAFADGVDWPAERKPLSVSFHFRRADDEAAARAYPARLARAAEREGLVPRFGRRSARIRSSVRGSFASALSRSRGSVILWRPLHHQPREAKASIVTPPRSSMSAPPPYSSLRASNAASFSSISKLISPDCG